MENKQRKILFVTSTLDVGGAEMHLINLVNNIDKKLIKPEVVHICKKEALKRYNLKYRFNSEINIKTIIRENTFDISVIDRLASFFVRGKFSAIYVNDLLSALFAYLVLKKTKSKLKIVFAIHTTVPRNLKHYLSFLLGFRILSNNKVIFVSTVRNQRLFLSQKYFIPLERLELILNGIDDSYFIPSPQDFNKKDFKIKNGIPADSSVIIKVGGYRHEKSHENAIKSLYYLRKNSSIDAYLVFLGGMDRSNRRPYLYEIVEEFELTKYVKFYDSETVKDVRPYLWSSDIFNLSSIAVETLSIATLEALSTGLPCVITDIGGARDIIRPGFNGYIVSPSNPQKSAEAWQKILKEKLVKNSKIIRQDVVKRFSLINTVKSYQRLLTN